MRSDICSRWPKRLASQYILENSESSFFLGDPVGLFCLFVFNVGLFDNNIF